MSDQGPLDQQNQQNAAQFGQEADKVYNDYEQLKGNEGGVPNLGQDVRDVEGADQGGEKFVQGEEKSFWDVGEGNLR